MAYKNSFKIFIIIITTIGSVKSQSLQQIEKDLFRSINNSRASSKDFFFENIDKTL